MSKSKQVFFARKFLNPPKVNAGAYIIASIEKYFHKGRFDKKKGKKLKDRIDREIVLSIGDCYRVINLEFDFWNKRQARQYLKKLDLLVDTLVKFRKAYKKEVEEYLKEDNRRYE